jgi:hypothetical protein
LELSSTFGLAADGVTSSTSVFAVVGAVVVGAVVVGAVVVGAGDVVGGAASWLDTGAAASAVSSSDKADHLINAYIKTAPCPNRSTSYPMTNCHFHCRYHCLLIASLQRRSNSPLPHPSMAFRLLQV